MSLPAVPVMLFESATPAADNIIQGNYIGTDETGMVALGNGGHGILVSGTGTSNNVIGGTVSGERNIIAGSIGSSIRLDTGTAGTTVQGNYIGVNAAGNASALVTVRQHR